MSDLKIGDEVINWHNERAIYLGNNNFICYNPCFASFTVYQSTDGQTFIHQGKTYTKYEPTGNHYMIGEALARLKEPIENME